MSTGLRSRRATLAVEVLERRMLLAADVEVGLNFTGSTDTVGPSVPDTMGSVGPAHIVELLNNAYAVYDKATGALISRVHSDVFWNTALASTGSGTTLNAVDSRLIYDHVSGHWFASALDRLDFFRRTILVGVSNSSNPTEGWKAFKIDPDPSDLYTADFPTLGLDGGGVYINVAMQDNPNDSTNPNPSFAITVISIPKADLIAATPSVANATVFPNLDPNASQANPFTWQQPVLDFGSYDGREPMVIGSGGGVTRTDVLNGAGPGPATLSSFSRSVASGPFGDSPPDAPQPGVTTLIETGGGLQRSAVPQQDNSLWMVTEELVNGRSGIRWMQLNQTTNQLLQSGTIGHPDLYLYYSSIAVNQFGDVVIGFSGSSANQYPSAYAVLGTTVNGVTSFGDIRLLQAGQGTFLAQFRGPIRWGDYSATVRDPNDPLKFWTFQEFVFAQDVWGVQVSELRVPLLKISETGGSTAVTEGSAPDTYTVALASQPSANVTVTINPGSQQTVSPGSLTFTPQNWNMAQTVNVSAVDDNEPEGPQLTTITYDLSSSDAKYNRAGAKSLSVNVSDNDRLWDGGGATNHWSDAANWSFDTMPQAGDQVIFNTTSVKNSTVDAAFAGTIGRLSIDSSYSGIITLDRSVTVGSLTGGGSSSNVNLASGTLITGADNTHTTFSGVISGSGGLTKIGTGSFYLRASSSYDGATTVNDGSILVSANNALGTTNGGTTVAAGSSARLVFERSVNYTTAEPVTINGSGFNGIGSLVGVGNSSFAGPITLGSASTVGAYPAGYTFTLSGSIDTGGQALTITGPGSTAMGGVVSGSGSLTKTGPGTLTLSNMSGYSGATTVAAGTLSVTGSISGSAATVASDGTLAGTGTIGATTASGGAVSPGAPGFGILSGSTANFSAAGILRIQVQGYGTPGSSFDRLNLGGLLTAGGTSKLSLDLAGLSSTGTATGVVQYGSSSGMFTTVELLNNSHNYSACPTYGATSLDILIQSGACPPGAFLADAPFVWTVPGNGQSARFFDGYRQSVNPAAARVGVPSAVPPGSQAAGSQTSASTALTAARAVLPRGSGVVPDGSELVDATLAGASETSGSMVDAAVGPVLSPFDLLTTDFPFLIP